MGRHTFVSAMLQVTATYFLYSRANRSLGVEDAVKRLLLHLLLLLLIFLLLLLLLLLLFLLLHLPLLLLFLVLLLLFLLLQLPLLGSALLPARGGLRGLWRRLLVLRHAQLQVDHLSDGLVGRHGGRCLGLRRHAAQQAALQRGGAAKGRAHRHGDVLAVGGERRGDLGDDLLLGGALGRWA